MWTLYILLCLDGSYYTGITNNLEKRFKRHLKGNGGAYTRSHPPIKIVYREEIKSRSEALKKEYQLKQLSKSEKEKLISYLG